MPSSFFSSLRTSAAVGLALAALTGCGGGSGDTAQPPATGLAAPENFTVQGVRSTWTATPGATRYEFHIDPDGPGPLPEVRVPDEAGAPGTQPTGFGYGSEDSLNFVGYLKDLHSYTSPDPIAGLNFTYRLRACDAQGCGAFTAPVGWAQALYYPGLGQLQGLDKDSLTGAFRWQESDGKFAIYFVMRDTLTAPWRQSAVLRSDNAEFGQKTVLTADGNTLVATEKVGSEVRLRGYQRVEGVWTEAALPLPAACGQPCRISINRWELTDDGSVLAAKAVMGGNPVVVFYTREGPTWSERSLLEADSDSFPTMMLSADGSVLAMRTFVERMGDVVVIYARDGATWLKRAVLETGNSSKPWGWMDLARDGKTLVVNQGGRYRDADTVPSFVLVFTAQVDGSWSQQARIPVGLVYFPDIAASAYSPLELSDDGNTLAVFAENWPEDRSGRAVASADLTCGPVGGAFTRYVALFARNGTTWQRQAALRQEGSIGPYGFTARMLARDGNALHYGGWLYTRSNGTWLCP